MISVQALIELEKQQLDTLAKQMSGSEFAEFVAKRTRKYFLQESIRALKRFDPRAADYLCTHMEELGGS